MSRPQPLLPKAALVPDELRGFRPVRSRLSRSAVRAPELRHGDSLRQDVGRARPMPADAPSENPHPPRLRIAADRRPPSSMPSACRVMATPPRSVRRRRTARFWTPHRYPVAYRPKSYMVTEPTLISPIPTEMLVAPEGIAGVVQLARVHVELLG